MAVPPSPNDLASARELVTAVEELTQQLAGYVPRSGDDAATIDLIAALETLKRATEGAQLAGAAELKRAATQRAADAGVPAERQHRGIAEQVALACRTSPHRGRQLLGLAAIAAKELPRAYRAARQGRITGWHLTELARETAHLALPERQKVDRILAGELDDLTAPQLGRRARALADSYDPAAAVKRRRHAETDRHVTLRPAPDTMTWLTALLPVKDGVAVYAALDAAAASARATGDPRGRGQVMADELVRRTRQPATGDSTQGDTRVRVNLVISDRALLGSSDEPARLDHYGPIPTELAREIVKTATTQQLAELRRLYADDHGHLVALESTSRCFPTGLADLIRLRDQTCRTPWCDAPIRHTDHIEPHADDGPTAFDNGQGLCEACNHARQAPGWTLVRTRAPDGQLHVEITTPTGHIYDSHPPPGPQPALHGHGLRIDLVLAG